MDNETKHTPLPWVLDHRFAGGVLIHPDDNEFLTVAKVLGFDNDEAKANAAFIVRAVNAHDDLIAALERLLQIVPPNSIPFGEADAAYAVLKKARG